MRKETAVYILVALTFLMIVSMFATPASAFIYTSTGTTDDKYEFYGPHADQILNQMYDTVDPEFTALQKGEIDLTDEPLTSTWLPILTANNNVSVVSAGGEAGYYTISFNDNPNPKMGQIFPFVEPYGQPDPAGRDNPVYIKGSSYSPAYPMDITPISHDINFRLGFCHLFDRASYAAVIGQTGVQMLSPVPPYMGNYSGGGYYWDLNPGYSFDLTVADTYFNASHIYRDLTGKRYWDFDHSVTNPNSPGAIPQAEYDAAALIFYYRSSPQIRTLAGTMLTTKLTAMGFVVTGGQVNGGQNYQYTMLDKNYHISTLGWIFVGPEPDYLYGTYHIAQYWDDPESSCGNTAALNDTVLDDESNGIMNSLTPAIARAHVYNFQVRFWQIAAELPLACNNAFKAMSSYYTGGTQGVLKTVDDGENQYRHLNWSGACNQMGFGSNSWFSKLNMYPEGYVYGTNNLMTIRYGWSETAYPAHINPYYSEWYWDSEVLGPIYDTLGYRDPYYLPNWKGDIAKSWTVGTWDDSGVTKSKVTVTIRSDARFQDGSYVTLADVIWSLVESGKKMIALGYTPPWWWSVGSKVASLSIIDAYTVEILYNVASYLVEGWTLGGFYLVPKHIWEPILEGYGGRPISDPFPDQNVIGSGPYRLSSWIEHTSLVLVANKPGSTVKITSDSFPDSTSVTSPGYHAWIPVQEYITSSTGKVKFDPNSTVYLNVTTDNLGWRAGTLDISDHVVITWPNTSTTVVDYAMTLAAHTSDMHTLGPYTWPKCRTVIEVNSTITTPGTWYGKSFYAKYFIWGSIREDITGSTYHKDMNLSPPYNATMAAEAPTPDCKVDAKDVAGAAAAFGSKPGQTKWWSVADIVHDYKINAKDIAAIASKFGFK